MPVESAEQRALLDVLLKLQWTLRDDQVSTWIRRPVFDVETDVGPRQPDFMLASYRALEQRRLLHLIELRDASGTADDLLPERVYKAPLDGVVRLDNVQLARLDITIADVARQLASSPCPASLGQT